jgi:hypothetical protein
MKSPVVFRGPMGHARGNDVCMAVDRVGDDAAKKAVSRIERRIQTRRGEHEKERARTRRHAPALCVGRYDEGTEEGKINRKCMI